jgi:hypothetical protein
VSLASSPAPSTLSLTSFSLSLISLIFYNVTISYKKNIDDRSNAFSRKL